MFGQNQASSLGGDLQFEAIVDNGRHPMITVVHHELKRKLYKKLCAKFRIDMYGPVALEKTATYKWNKRFSERFCYAADLPITERTAKFNVLKVKFQKMI